LILHGALELSSYLVQLTAISLALKDLLIIEGFPALAVALPKLTE
jgi:hypothetical protein